MTTNDDLTGKTFGLLTVISEANITIIHRNKFWLCRCDCGRIIYVSTTNLHMGYTDRCPECKELDRATADL